MNLNMSLKKLLALLAVLALVAAACGSDDDADESSDVDTEETADAEAEETAEAEADETSDPEEGTGDGEDADVKAAFVMVAPIGDAGWNFMHNEGRLGAADATGVETAFVESVPEGGAEFDTAVQNFIDEGYNVIFTTSFGYMDATEKFAEENPDVIFEHISGFKMNDTNFGNTFGRMYQPRYIAGMAAGAATESDRIGYVAAFPIPEVIRGINAFALGVQRTNPDAVVEVSWTSTWFGIAEEGAAAQALIDNGADVLTMHQDSTATGQAITDAGGTFIGYHSDMSSQVDAYLTAPVWNWTPRYSEVIESVQNGSYSPSSYWGSMADGVVDIDVPDSSPVAGEMTDVKQQILDGEFDVFDQGTITAQDGTVIFEDGEIVNGFPDAFDASVTVGNPGDPVDDGILLGMNFFVENVIGTLG